MQALGAIFLLMGIIVSARERKYRMMYRSSEPSSNLLASALSQLVGTAGGIYLSLELLFSFLKLPEDWWSNNSIFFVEPLAVISLLLAIVQPFAIKAWAKLRK